MGVELIGEPRHFHTKHKFRLELDGFKNGDVAFAKCSELKVDVAEIAYYEGGMITPHKEPGRLTFSDITLERAVTSDADIYNWLVDTANAATNSGIVSRRFKRGGFIVQYDRDNIVLRKWQLYGLWPKSVTVGAWDNGADELTMETVVLAFDYFVLRRNDARTTQTSLIGGIASSVRNFAAGA